MRPRVTLAILAFLFASPVGASIISVSPGPGTPVQDAINAAAPGDTVLLAAGNYPEAVVVDKRLHLRGAGNIHTALSYIDAGCNAPTALTIAADDVTVQGLFAHSGTVSAISVQNRHRVRFKVVGAVAYGAGTGLGCGTELYGFDVSQSTRVKISDSALYGSIFGAPGTMGFLTAGIYLHDLAPRAGINIERTFSTGHVNGFVIENAMGPAAVRIHHDYTAAHDTGILLKNSSHIRVQSSYVNALDNTSPIVGIHLDATSSDNGIFTNNVSGYNTDVLDDGTNNCWRGNTFITGSVPSSGCM